jgi:hypothetical protein
LVVDHFRNYQQCVEQGVNEGLQNLSINFRGQLCNALTGSFANGVVVSSGAPANKQNTGAGRFLTVIII